MTTEDKARGAGTSDKPVVFVAPSERHPAIRNLADKFSNLPEQYGCDIIWRAQGEWWGVQRKEIKDFIASQIDGRLGKELGQMQGHVPLPIVVIEGRIQWSNDGVMLHSSWGRPITRRMFHGMLFGLGLKGAMILFSDHQEGTAELVDNLLAWSVKERHNSLDRRPGPEVTSAWGKATNTDWARHFLQGFPGIGPTVAQAILDEFGGIPMKWTVDIPALVRIPGVGKARAKALVEMFDKLEGK